MTLRMIILLTIALLTSYTASANNEIKAIERTLNNYIAGSSFNDKQLIKSAFYSKANLYLEKKETPLWTVAIDDYANWFKEENKGKFNGRIGEILAIDIEGNIATAKVEILLPEKNVRFVDLFLLKKLDQQWKIISKSAVQKPKPHNGQRILFIVSNAHFHGDSELPAGVSFSEIVKAFDVFKQAGYTVDFVSPEGGAIPLSYINTSEKIHKQYLYNRDFMYAISNTKKPRDIDASKYRAVHYVGGNNAMYGVAENVSIQRITMDIYEKYNGIISSVCHGTAGIINLKTSDGNYLVKDRNISGYPEKFENQSKAYFQEFPFLIQKTIEERGGKFFHAERNTAHVVVDDRIITGQNHLSSPLVAMRMIERLQENNSQDQNK